MRNKTKYTKKYDRLENALLDLLNSGAGAFGIEAIEDKIWNGAGLKTKKQRQRHLDKFNSDILETL